MAPANSRQREAKLLQDTKGCSPDDLWEVQAALNCVRRDVSRAELRPGAIKQRGSGGVLRLRRLRVSGLGEEFHKELSTPQQPTNQLCG